MARLAMGDSGNVPPLEPRAKRVERVIVSPGAIGSFPVAAVAHSESQTNDVTLYASVIVTYAIQ